MFAIGESKSKVFNAKLLIPVQYHLRRKRVYETWINDEILYLSDEEAPLRAKKGSEIVESVIDCNNYLRLNDTYNGRQAVITGLISTIQIRFEGGLNV